MILCIDTIVLCYINLNPVGLLLGVDGYLCRGWVWPIEDAFGYILLQAFGSVIGIGLIIRGYQPGMPLMWQSINIQFLSSHHFYAWFAFSEALSVAQFMSICLFASAEALIALR